MSSLTGYGIYVSFASSFNLFEYFLVEFVFFVLSMSWVGGSVKKVCSKICALLKNLTLTSLCKIKPSPSKRKMGTILIVPPSLKWGNHPWDLKLKSIDHYCLIFQIKACHHIDCEDFEGKNALPFCQRSVDKENFRGKKIVTKFIPGKKSASKWCASTSSAVTESGGPSCGLSSSTSSESSVQHSGPPTPLLAPSLIPIPLPSPMSIPIPITITAV